MAAGCGVPLRLGNFFNMKQSRDMGFPHARDRVLENLAHTGIVPCLYLVYINAVGAFFFLHPFKRFRDRSFGSLQFLWYRNTITIIPHEHGKWYLQHACSVDYFPEMTL